MSSRNKFTVVSTFSGCGGSSLGYKLAGGDVRLAVEWDKHAAKTYRDNFPSTPLFYGDIGKLSIRRCCQLAGIEPGELDIFDGSPPCQGFSVCTHGRRGHKKRRRDVVKGRRSDDQRNQLFREYVRLLRGLKPKAFVMENVPGMVQGKMKLIFAECFKELKTSGYHVVAKVLSTQFYNVPQSRSRLIFIGVRTDLEIQPTHPPPQARPICVRAAFEGLPEIETRTLSEQGLTIWKQLKPGQWFSEKHPKQHWFNAIKLNPNQPANTITRMVMAMGASGLFHWKHPRVLTIAEVKRISSFPDDFILSGTFKEQWARIGNSVPPRFMQAIAEHIKTEVLDVVAADVSNTQAVGV
tara:strand:+ start:2373 stop:3428 length:1056 start_codon:yes stop_codon:yes gene_type:complete